jgi:nicotinate-nucleotide--dimethylbenzimidazole phosphoribosyltransferase
MVMTFLAEKACVNAFARAVNIDVRVVDAGVASDFPPHPRLIHAKVRRGTRNAAKEPALTPQAAQQDQWQRAAGNRQNSMPAP